jgi:hypothetical protein
VYSIPSRDVKNDRRRKKEFAVFVRGEGNIVYSDEKQQNCIHDSEKKVMAVDSDMDVNKTPISFPSVAVLIFRVLVC